MPHTYLNVLSLQRRASIGDGSCVTLVRELTTLKNRHTSSWRQGASVIETRDLTPGTAIATFVNGRWPGLKKGNHAAFYLRHDGDRIFIMDQYDGKTIISSRPIERLGKNKDGTYRRTSDNADAFFVIE